MSNIIIWIILLMNAVLGIFVGIRLKSGKLRLGFVMCILGLFPLIIGIHLFPATMWRMISIVCLLIAMIMIASGITVIMKSR